jgi:hypothetical protein
VTIFEMLASDNDLDGRQVRTAIGRLIPLTTHLLASRFERRGMMQRYWTNSLASGLSENMKIGTEIVLYADHLAVLAEKDKYSRKLLDENIDLSNENAAQRKQIADLTAEFARSELRQKILSDKWTKENLELSATSAKQAEAISGLQTMIRNHFERCRGWYGPDPLWEAYTNALKEANHG